MDDKTVLNRINELVARRAKRHAGQDPDEVQPRDPSTVEGYLQ